MQCEYKNDKAVWVLPQNASEKPNNTKKMDKIDDLKTGVLKGEVAGVLCIHVDDVPFAGNELNRKAKEKQPSASGTD